VPDPVATAKWFEFGRTTLAAIAGATLAIFATGKAEGKAEAKLDAVVERAADHEGRIRAIEGKVGDVAADVRWLRTALTTGRDPATGNRLPIADPVPAPSAPNR
jgi:hypothetical protein